MGQEQGHRDRIKFADAIVETCPICGHALRCTRTIKSGQGPVRQELSCKDHGLIGWRYKRLANA